MPSIVSFEPASYRDRAARVFYDSEGSVFRALSEPALKTWDLLRRTPFFNEAVASGQIVPTKPCPEPDQLLQNLAGAWSAVIEHERIRFISYPYEWSFGMLQDAALTFLDLLNNALSQDFIIKDGWAWNTQWRGTRPVFVDLGSFEPWDQPEPWSGYRQFCQTFLFPLMIQAYRNIPFQVWLRGRLEGITPQECRDVLSITNIFRRGVWSHVRMHAWLDSLHAQQDANTSRLLADAGFQRKLVVNNIRNLRRLVARLRWRPQTTVWSDYNDTKSYSATDEARKQCLVRQWAGSRRWKMAWDLGCNTGGFSRAIAEFSDYVVAIDADQSCVEQLYQTLRTEGDPVKDRILPLIGNLADMTEGLGWRGRERVGLAARGQPDLVLCLALVHHLALTHAIPISDLVDWLGALRTSLIIEFVDRHDPMVQRLLRRRLDDPPEYGRDGFEQALRKRFDIVQSETLGMGTRTMYFAHPKAAS